MGPAIGNFQSIHTLQSYFHHNFRYLDVQLVCPESPLFLPFLFCIHDCHDSLLTFAPSIIGLVTPDMLDSITWGTYIFFAAFCLLAFGFTFFFIPETRGKVCLVCPWLST